MECHEKCSQGCPSWPHPPALRPPPATRTSKLIFKTILLCPVALNHEVILLQFYKSQIFSYDRPYFLFLSHSSFSLIQSPTSEQLPENAVVQSHSGSPLFPNEPKLDYKPTKRKNVKKPDEGFPCCCPTTDPARPGRGEKVSLGCHCQRKCGCVKT